MDQSVIHNHGGYTEEILLKEVSADELQEREVQKSHSTAVFSPPFIQFDPELQRTFDLTDKETLIFGFISYYTKYNAKRFYFTNEQLAQVVNCSERTATESIKKLNALGLIKSSYKIKANGGTIRFVEGAGSKNCESDPGWTRKNCESDSQKLLPNKNKINKNKLLKRIMFVLGAGQILPKDLQKEIAGDPSLRKQFKHLLSEDMC